MGLSLKLRFGKVWYGLENTKKNGKKIPVSPVITYSKNTVMFILGVRLWITGATLLDARWRWRVVKAGSSRRLDGIGHASLGRVKAATGNDSIGLEVLP